MQKSDSSRARAARDVDQIETEHRLQIEDFSAILNAMKRGGNRELVAALLTGLVNSTEAHFRSEEDAAFHSNDPHAAAHALEHRAMTHRLADIQEAFEAGELDAAIDLLTTLESRLGSHTRAMDQMLEDHLREEAEPSE